MKSANTLYKQKNYPAAIKQYLRIVASDMDHGVLATQAYFNLNLISKDLWIGLKKESIELGEDFASWVGMSELKGFSAIIDRINDLASSNPAYEVTVSLYGFYQAAFCALHKFYWKSSIKVQRSASLLSVSDDVTSGLTDDQREQFLETLISFLEKDAADQSKLRTLSVQGSVLPLIDQHITDCLGRDKSIWHVVLGLHSVRPEVSIVVPNLNGAAQLTRMLYSLVEQVDRSASTLEVIVVGYGSNDDSSSVCDKFSGLLDINSIQYDGECVRSRIFNFGAKKAKFSNILFLRSDIVFESDSIIESMRLLKEDGVGCVGARLTDESGGANGGSMSFTWDQKRHCHLPVRVGADVSFDPSVMMVSCDHLLCRKSDFFAVGGFDESFFNDLEDADFCLRIKEYLHKKVMCAENVDVALSLQQSDDQESNEYKVVRDQNCRVFKAAWGARLASQLKKKQPHSLARTENAYVSKAGYKSLIRATCNILDEDGAETLLRRPSGELDHIVFREEAFSDGKLRAWVAAPNESVFEGLKACMVINGKLVKSIDIMANRPDVRRALGKPAGEVLLAIPKKYFDGESHDIKLVLSKNSFCRVIVTKIFKESSVWLKERDRAESAGRKVVFFASHSLKVQGAQTSLFQTVVGLKRDARLYPVVFSPIDGPLRKSYEHHGIPVIVQKYPRIGGATEAVWRSEFEYFVSCLSALSPKVVVANTLQSYHSAIAGLALSIPTVLVPRESEDPATYFSNVPSFLKAYADSLVGCVDQAVFVAQATRNLWSHVDQGNQCVIYNGLAISELERKLAGVTRESARLTLGFGEDDRVVLSVGTVSERKGQLDLLKAIPHIVSKTSGLSLKFVFVGMNDNEYSRAMQDAFSRLPKNLQSAVHLLPHTDDDKDCLVQQLYLASDMFVLNSIHESYPRVVLEALYFGLPVVTTRCFGVVEQVEENKSGLFYEYGNHYELACQVSSVVGSESHLTKFSKFAYERFKALTSYEEMVDSYKSLIYRLMEQ